MSPANDLTTEQIEGIQIDYGIVYADYGEDTQRKLGPTRGGAEFTASKNIRDIEYDGRLGKTKGAQVIDEINAMLKTSILDMSQETLSLAMPQADLSAGVLTNNTGGLIPSTKYLKNVTMFCKTIGGEYKKITLYNSMSESDFSFAAAPKAEGVVQLEVWGHWDATNQESPLYTIEDIADITDEGVAPTVATVPADAATGVARSAVLTATFDKPIRPGDVIAANFILIKAIDGSIVDGTLTYNSTLKQVLFQPGALLAASENYLWTITRVRDMAGNTMDTYVANFTTAS